MIILKPQAGECLQCMKEPAKKVAKNSVTVFCYNSCCKKEEVGHVQQKSS